MSETQSEMFPVHEPEDADPAPTEVPYRGPWQDEKGMCTTRCPACKPTGPTLRRDEGWHDCRVTQGRVTPVKSVCDVRSMYEAFRRRPED